LQDLLRKKNDSLLKILQTQDFFMQLPIHSVADLGLALRAVRRSSKLRLDDMAATAGVSKQFASDVELGKETIRMGLVFKLLDEMGLSLSVDIPDQSGPELALLQSKAAAEPKAFQKSKRRSPAAAGSAQVVGDKKL
jgi:transcriptional regulator with XRE-family HTH domain